MYNMYNRTMWKIGHDLRYGCSKEDVLKKYEGIHRSQESTAFVEGE